MTFFFLKPRPSTETLEQINKRFNGYMEKFQDKHCDCRSVLSYYQTRFKNCINEAQSEKERKKYLQSYALFATTLAKCMNNNSKQKDPIVQYLNSPYYYSPIKPAQEYSYSLVDKAASVSASILSLIFVGCALATALAVINPVLGFAVLAALLTSTMPSLFYLATVAHPAKKQFDKEQIKTEEDTKRQEVQLFKSVQKAFSSAAANDEEEMQLMETMQNLV